MFVPRIEQHLERKENLHILNTTTIDEIDTAIKIANNIIDGMEEKYIKVKSRKRVS
jgi:hypothetical protein